MIEQEEAQEREVYFDEMDFDDGIPEMELGEISLGVPLTRFSTANLWY